jgi:hypothetical protein
MNILVPYNEVKLTSWENIRPSMTTAHGHTPQDSSFIVTIFTIPHLTSSSEVDDEIKANYTLNFEAQNNIFNPLKTKRELFYLKIQFVPRSKHFSSGLYKPVSLCHIRQKSLFVLK